MVGDFEIDRRRLAVPVHIDAVAQVAHAEFRDERRFAGDHDFVGHGKIGDGRDQRAQPEAGAVHQIRGLCFAGARGGREFVECGRPADYLRIFRCDRIVSQARRASLMSGNAARSVRIDKNVPDQSVAFIGIVDRLAVHGERVAYADADRHHGETVQSDARAEQACVHRQRIDIVVNAGRQAGRLANHRRKFHRLRPVQERCERRHRIVRDMSAQ